MKRNLTILLFWTFHSITCQAQRIELKNLLTYLGDKDFRIGMSLKDFNKIENDYYLVNGDSSLLGKDISSEEFLGHQVDKIYYVFNNRKTLLEINWFLPSVNEKDLVINDIVSILGKPNSSEKNTDENKDKIIWQQDSLSLTYNYENENDRLFVSLTNPFVEEDLSIFNVNKRYEKLIKLERQGKGNETFNLSLNSLEKIVTTGTTAKKFESILPSWEIDTYYNWVGLTTNKKTNVDDIPVFHLGYDFKTKRNYVIAKLEVKGNINGIINSIELIYAVDGKSLAKFRNDLKLRGYYFDEILTKVSYNFNENKDIYINRSKGVMVLITATSNGYSFEARKL